MATTAISKRRAKATAGSANAARSSGVISPHSRAVCQRRFKDPTLRQEDERHERQGGQEKDHREQHPARCQAQPWVALGPSRRQASEQDRWAATNDELFERSSRLCERVGRLWIACPRRQPQDHPPTHQARDKREGDADVQELDEVRRFYPRTAQPGLGPSVVRSRHRRVVLGLTITEEIDETTLLDPLGGPAMRVSLSTRLGHGDSRSNDQMSAPPGASSSYTREWRRALPERSRFGYRLARSPRSRRPGGGRSRPIR